MLMNLIMAVLFIDICHKNRKCELAGIVRGKTQIQSTGIIEVDTTAMTMETIPGNRAVTTGKPDRKEEKKEEKCPRCDKDITLEEIKNICVDGKGKCLIKDEILIKAAIPYLNQYRKKSRY
jgi:hypothetical protein